MKTNVIRNILLFIVISIAFQGCRSKKNVVNLEKTKIVAKDESKTETITEIEIKTDSIAESGSSSITTTDNETIEAEALNDSTELVIEKKRTGNVTEWKFKGAKNVKIGDKKQTKTKRDTSSVNLVKNEIKKEEQKSETKSETTTESKKKDTDRQATGLSPWISVGIGLGFVLLILFLYLRQRKRNRFLP